MYAAQTGVFHGILASLAGRLVRRPAVPAASAPTVRARVNAPLLDLAPLDSFEPYRDYRPGGRSGDPCRPW